MAEKNANKIERLKLYFDSEILPYSKLLRLFLPVLWEQLFLAVVAILSIWLLSMDGESSVSVANMVAVVNKVFTSACLGIVTGGTVCVAQNIGAGRIEQAAKSAAHTMGLAFVLSAAAGLGLFFGRAPFIGHLLAGAQEDIVSQAVTYFSGFCVSFPFYAFYQSFAGAMRGWGHTKIAWRITLAVNCTELLFIVYFLLHLKLGVPGLTAAMVLSRVVGACLAFVMLLGCKNKMGFRLAYFIKPDKTILRGIFIIAVPLALEQIFFNGGKAYSQKYIAGYGVAHMAANGAVNAIFELVNLPQAALRETLVTVVGMCIGSGRPELAKRYVYRFMRAIRMAILALLPLTVLASAALIRWYGLSAEANWLVVMCLGLILTFGPLFLAGSFTIPAGLRAGGDAAYVSAAALCCMWGVRVTLSYLFAGVLNLGVVGINLAMAIEWAVRNQLFRFRLKGERWHSHQLIAGKEAT